jgi:hypothetical protein
MRNRARPATLFTLLGVILRISQRIGIHRDGDVLGLPIAKAEERRRTWWQIQYLEISISQLIGCISITLYAGWDVKLPANLDDDDFSSDMTTLPPNRVGLTSMSPVLWSYFVLDYTRRMRTPPTSATWIILNDSGPENQANVYEGYRSMLADRFLQYCEILNPLHVVMQIQIQVFLLAMQRVGAQPNLRSSRISDMPQANRDKLLAICIKGMDYYILGETTPALARFKWNIENYFQWTAIVYIVIEAHHRAATREAEGLWQLIGKVCEVHPKLMTAVHFPEVSAVARLAVLAWKQRRENWEKGTSGVELTEKGLETPWYIDVFQRMLDGGKESEEAGEAAVGGLEDFDFDLIDWDFWETGVRAS